MESFRYVILGGGMVAGYAAKAFVEHGIGRGELGIVSADTAVPYERPPLSKGLLRGEESEDGILINRPEFYPEHGIQNLLETPVEQVDTEARMLRLRGGETWRFEKLLIATGASARTLSVPGSGLDGVLYLRSLDDAKRIRDRAAGAKRAVVIGGGFIGMEAAASLAMRGLEVTMVLPEERIWSRLFTPAMSGFFQNCYASRGVTVRTQAKVNGFSGQGRVEAVDTSAGRLEADFVVAGIGVNPETALFEGSRVAVSNGVLVNEYLETGVPGVYAAGDVANYQDVLAGKRRRVEHWDNAVSQGQHAARVIAGDRAPFEHVPYFFSDVFDLSYEFWGDSSAFDREVLRGRPEDRSFSVWWLRQGRVVAAFVMSRPDEERELAPQWVREGKRVNTERLADASQALV